MTKGKTKRFNPIKDKDKKRYRKLPLISPGLGFYVFVRGLRRAYNRALITGINEVLRNKP